MTAQQLTEWEEYDKLEPIGDWKINHLLAYGLSVVSNLFIKFHGKRGSKLTSVSDFLIEWAAPEKKKEQPEKVETVQKQTAKPVQSAEEIKAFMMAFAKLQNERYKREQKKNLPTKNKKKDE